VIGDAVGYNVYRNKSLIQVGRYNADESSKDEIVQLLRAKWASLREKGLAGDYPVAIFVAEAPESEVVEVFRWRSEEDRLEAEADRDHVLLQEQLRTLELTNAVYTEAIRGFNQNFPHIGGVELLKGVCSCLLSVDGLVEDYPMSVKNGIVLMHRSPQLDFDGDGKNEMYLKILMHGGETVQEALGPIRVEQNFNMPNDGIVKSSGVGGNDFPGTAIWRVAWRIQTSIGPVLTDPETPLIFGPATVQHYPPVGTHFHSSTGPVALIHEESGARVGTLKPGELTAFDIVVTKDDEIFADILNSPPPDIFDLLDEYSHKTVRERVASPSSSGGY
jgi:hypothetical protein